jgi:precorrin-8X/cobalt-precorrin-8 methylmutase
MENIIVIAHGSPKIGANNIKEAVRDLHATLHPGCPDDCIHVAYLQFARPDLPEAISLSVARGASRIIIHPLFLVPGIHVSRDIPALVEQARQDFPGVVFALTPPLGLSGLVIEAAAEKIREALLLSPGEIEARSFAVIAREIDWNGIRPEQQPIIARVIHATGDFDFRDDLVFHAQAVQRGLEAIRAGLAVVTDVEMLKAGISKGLLQTFGGQVRCSLAAPGEDPLSGPGTRSARGIAAALEKVDEIGILAIGNAPTALLTAISLLSRRPPGSWIPLVVGTPVGFIQAVESKELLARQAFPFITNRSRKGGSAVAAAIVNALLRIAQGEEKT